MAVISQGKYLANKFKTDIKTNTYLEKFEDTKGLIRNNKLKERQYNGLQNILVCINHVSRKWRKRVKVRVMVLNATFNNISVILWRSVLLVEETGGPGETHRPAKCHWKTLSHNVVSSTEIIVIPTTIRSRPRRPHLWWYVLHTSVICEIKIISYIR